MSIEKIRKIMDDTISMVPEFGAAPGDATDKPPC